MIELLTRQEVFKLNKTFASFIMAVQDAQYNPLLDANKCKPGEMYVDDSAVPRLVTQEECDQWNSEQNEEYLKRKDCFDTVQIAKRHAGESVYRLPSADIDTYLESLSEGMLSLANALNWQSVIFLLDYPIPWLYQENDYKQVKEACVYLKKIGVADSFVGGLKASGHDLKELTKSLFWIIRCNAALPNCYFSGVDTDFAADICKYGNIHFHFYDIKERLEIIQASKDIGMIEIEDGRCVENFSDTNAIGGRQIIV